LNTPDPSYKGYTLSRFNGAIAKQVEKKEGRIRGMLIFSGSTMFLFPGGPIIRDLIDAALFAAKISWLIPLPLLVIQNASINRILTPDLLIDVKKIRERRDLLKSKRIIYTITTKGDNLETLSDSFDSTVHWIGSVKEKHGIEFNAEVWVVTEEDSYERNRDYYGGLEERGGVIIATPRAYATPHNTRFKARALHYATQVRNERGINTADDWVYHQDTETMIGEDTVLGNLGFILDADERRLNGMGIILYPQDWRYRYNSVEETTRTVGDIGAMGQADMWGAIPFGYHGSHFIVRADVEDEIGWDFGGARSEDLLFCLRLRKRYGPVTSQMKGFAYEKPPLTFADHLKQRRRWILGSMEVLRRREIPVRLKAPLVYGLLSWMSALPSLAVALISLFRPTGGVIDYIGGLIAGFTWWSIISTYRVGLEIHENYVENHVPWKLFRVISSSALGIVADAVSPWYALIKRTNGYDEIAKDVRVNLPRGTRRTVDTLGHRVPQ
jgi:hypothetical protein